MADKSLPAVTAAMQDEFSENQAEPETRNDICRLRGVPSQIETLANSVEPSVHVQLPAHFDAKMLTVKFPSAVTAP